MVGWIILAVLVGLITLILLIPIGADIRYEDGVIRISAKAAGIKLQLLPRKKREPKPEKPVENKEEKPKPEKPRKERKGKKKRSLSLNAEEILDLIKTVLRGFGRFGRKFKIERFRLHWIATGRDPYITARVFSVVNAGLSQLAPVCAERFQCSDSSVWTDLDFSLEDMFFEFGITATIRIGQILGTGLRIGFGALKILLRSRRRVKIETREEAAALQKWLSDHPEDVEKLQELQKQEIKDPAAGTESPEAPSISEATNTNSKETDSYRLENSEQ